MYNFYRFCIYHNTKVCVAYNRFFVFFSLRLCKILEDLFSFFDFPYNVTICIFLNIVRFNRILQILQIFPILLFQFRFHTKNILQILPIQIEIEIEFFSETCSYNIHLYIFLNCF